jgi:hypothetical protein
MSPPIKKTIKDNNTQIRGLFPIVLAIPGTILPIARETTRI